MRALFLRLQLFVGALLFSFLLLCSSSQAAAFLSGVTVVIDQSHGQVFSPYNPTFGGYTAWCQALRKWGAHVRLNSTPLSRVLPRYGRGSLFVLGLSILPRYPKSLPRLLTDYVKRGGNVLLLSEHDNLFRNAENQNKLSQPFGIQTLPTGVFTTRKDTGNPVWIWSTAPRLRVSKFQFYYAAPLKLQGAAKPLVLAQQPKRWKHRVLGAISRLGQGRFVALGDAEIFWDGNPKMGLSHANNLLFVQKLFAFFFEKKRSPSSHSRPTSQPMQQPTSKATLQGIRRPASKPSRFATTRPRFKAGPLVVFVPSAVGLGKEEELKRFASALTKGGYRVVEGNTPALFAKADLVVVSQPVRPLRHVKELQQARRLLLLADGMSDFLRHRPEHEKLFRRLLKHPVVKPLPWDALTVRLGLQFRLGTVLSGQTNPLQAPVQWSNGVRWSMWRGAAIAVRGKGWRVLARTAPGTWWTVSLMGVHREDGKHDNPFVPPNVSKQKGGLPVVVSSPKVFAVSDVELFTNAYFSTLDGQEMWKRVRRWLSRDSGGRKPQQRRQR